MKKLDREDPREVISLRDSILHSAENFGDKAVYIYKENKEEHCTTYSELKNYIECFSTALSALDLLGEHIAVIGETSYKNTVSYYGTIAVGGVVVPLDREISAEQIVNFLNLAECKAIVYSKNFNGILTKEADKLPNLKYFIPMNEGDSLDEKFSNTHRLIEWEDFLNIGSEAISNGDDIFYTYETDLDKMCAILFTSGTTGTSKGVMLSERNLCAASYASALTTPYDNNTKLCSVLPQHHTYEMTCGHLVMIHLGASAFINDSLKYVVRNFSAQKPTALILVPLFVETLYKKIKEEINKKGIGNKVKIGEAVSDTLLNVGVDLRPKLFSQITSALGGKVESIICGGAPVSPSILKEFYSWGITIYEGYGITECAPLVACNPPGKKPRFGSVGKAVHGVTVMIDKASEEDKTGEILVKGDNVMLGYYKNEQATKEVFTEDGWFKTGDIGYIDKDGYIFITGRKKNVIILSNGKNVFPEELEEHLSHCDLIKECIVIGRKNNDGETTICALIYPEFEKLEDKTDEEIKTILKDEVNKINRSLPSFKHMTEIEVKKEEFIKSTSKKIKRYLYK